MHINENATLGLLLGTMGSGKSFSIAKMLVEEFIPYYTGEFWTNIPLHADAIAEYCAKRYKLDADQVKARIRRIPDEEVLLWIEGKSNVFSFMDGVFERRCAQYEHDPNVLDEDKFPPGLVHPLSRSLVVVDEAADFFPKTPNPEYSKAIRSQIDVVKKRVRKVRHFGARVLYVFQRLEDIEPAFRDLAEFRVVLTKLGTQPIPFVEMTVDDFFQLFAKITGVYLQWTTRETLIRYQESFQKMGSGQRFFIHKKFFPFYDSHNVEGKGSGAPDLPAYLRLKWKPFLTWWWRRNWYGFTKCTLIIAAILYFVYPGGKAMAIFHNIRHEFSAAYDEALRKQTVGRDRGTKQQPTAKEMAASDNAGLDELRESNLELANRVLELSELLEALSEDRERLTAVVNRASQLVMIDATGVVLRSGERVNVQEEIPTGPYRGRVVTQVDHRANRVSLDDGTVLRLERMQEPILSANGNDPTGVPGSLPGTTPDAEGWYSQNRQAAANPTGLQRGTDANDAIRIRPSTESGYLNRDGRFTPTPASYYDDDPAAARASAGFSQPPNERPRASSEPNTLLSRPTAARR